MARGAEEALPHCRCLPHPVTDGGEGFAEAMTIAAGGEMLSAEVTGPLPGQRVRALWGYVVSTRTAFIEMAQAAGLVLVPVADRDPKITTTYGVGELVRIAVGRGATSVVMGLGGSATTDGGSGMMEALGVRFLDDQGRRLPRGGAALGRLATIDTTGLRPGLSRVRFSAACDVSNPLTGPEGAAVVYAPQKGGTPEDVAILDAALVHYRDVLRGTFSVDVQDVPGTGAAGGLGAALVAFLGARMERGVDLVLDATGFDRSLDDADVVLTGEGRLDRQIRYGKALSGILERARRRGRPVIAIVGTTEGDAASYTGVGGFDAVYRLIDASGGVDAAMHDAAALLTRVTREALHAWALQAGIQDSTTMSIP
jgi:glycerate kinase